MMMEANITLDHIATHDDLDLQKLCRGNLVDQWDDSPYSLVNNTCSYYEPTAVQNVLSTGLSMFCMNIQGLRAHWDAFQNLLFNLCGESQSFDIIGITELFSMTKGECALPGYHPLHFITRNDTTNSKGGVGIFVNNSYQYKHRPDLSLFIPHIFESLFIELSFDKKCIIIGNIYRPNTYPLADLDIFMHNMNELQSTLATENKEVFMMGDFNIDMLKFRDHSKTSAYIEDIFSQGFLPLITKPTRVTDHSATLIDHIYTNKTNLHATSGIIITDISDHFGIFSTIKYDYEKKMSRPTHKMIRSFSENNINNFNNILSQSDFASVTNQNNVNLAYNSFIDIYKAAYDRAFPLKEVKLIKKYQKLTPWTTRGLVTSSITKIKLLKMKLKSPTVENKLRWSNFCKIYNKLLRQAKVMYFKEQFDLAKCDMRKTWTLLKTAINKHNIRDILPTSFKYNNTLITDTKEISDKFNKFFVNIGWDISNNVSATDINYSQYLNPPNQHSIFLDPIDDHNIMEIVNNIKTKTSLDNNNISTKLLKCSIGQVAKPLSHIINISLSTGTCPDNMKVAKVIPIFKSGDKSEFTNYRPISILPVFSKIMEKIIAKKLVHFLNDTKQLHKHQFGFRAHHSTIHPVIHLLNQIAEHNDKPSKDVTMATFLDLSKAFDTISHSILLKKLYNMGIRGLANSWFDSYLSNRKQYMDINNNKSSHETIKCGVPQGSILGPLLFIIYINDIHNSTMLKLFCFADDTTCSYSSSNHADLFNTMNYELEQLNVWFKANKLCLNANKTKYMIFGPSVLQDNFDNYEINIDTNKIGRISRGNNKTTFTFLGIEMDETLTWKEHISKVCSKISRSNYILNKVKHTIPKTCLLTLYQSLVHCHINYGLIIWGASTAIERVHKLQKKSIRIINRKPYNYHTEPLFKECKILTIKDQYVLNCVTFMHQIKSNKAPLSFQTLQHFIEPTRPTRYPNMAIQRKARTKFTSLLPYHRLPQNWNNLVLHMRAMKSTKQVQSSLKTSLLEQYAAYVKCANRRCKQCFPHGIIIP